MYKSLEELVQRIIEKLQSENEGCLFDQQDEQIIYKILSSAHGRIECEDKLDKDQICFFLVLTSHQVRV